MNISQNNECLGMGLMMGSIAVGVMLTLSIAFFRVTHLQRVILGCVGTTTPIVGSILGGVVWAYPLKRRHEVQKVEEASRGGLNINH